MDDDPALIRLLKKTARRSSLRLRYLGRRIESPANANALIRRLIFNRKAPQLINRIGASEAVALQEYRQQNQLNEPTRQRLLTLSGVFPASKKQGNEFCQTYLQAIEESDLIGIWGVTGESGLTRKFAPHAQLTELQALEPYYHDEPWSEALAGRKVLVVHPFARLIESQYRKRERLFKDPRVLPEFEALITLPAVQSIGGSDEFDSWSEALQFQKEQISEQDFDIALIGAGAYGLPLGAHVKSLGKHAIQMGGSLQILFGIKGKRWDQHPQISKLYNEHWVRPGANERPKTYQQVEGGCYW